MQNKEEQSKPKKMTSKRGQYVQRGRSEGRKTDCGLNYTSPRVDRKFTAVSYFPYNLFVLVKTRHCHRQPTKLYV